MGAFNDLPLEARGEGAYWERLVAETTPENTHRKPRNSIFNSYYLYLGVYLKMLHKESFTKTKKKLDLHVRLCYNIPVKTLSLDTYTNSKEDK